MFTILKVLSRGMGHWALGIGHWEETSPLPLLVTLIISVKK
jgi:hypothetical protein